MLSIWVTRRSTRRKLLLVIRTMVAMAVAWPIPPSAVVPVAGSRWGEDGRQFVRSELSVFVGEADAAVELRVASKTFLDARPMRTTPVLCRSK